MLNFCSHVNDEGVGCESKATYQVVDPNNEPNNKLGCEPTFTCDKHLEEFENEDFVITKLSKTESN